MIIGTGLIATHLIPYDTADVVFFASGVSNSQEQGADVFLRESDLILNTIAENQGKIFVYYSTYSICDPSMAEKPYILHKIAMENLIAQHAKRYLIIRTSNLVGKTPNPNTIANYLAAKVRSGEHFECWNVQRNLLYISHLCAMTGYVLQAEYTEAAHNLLPINTRQTVFLVNPVAYPVLDIVQCMEQIFDKKANYTLVNKGANFEIDTTLSAQIFQKLHIDTDNYLARILPVIL
jgi:nucleoside-diphosphate-sugar epimerase